MRTYPLHGQIPVLVHEGLVADREQRHMPCLDRRRGRIDGEELDVEGVQLVWDIPISILSLGRHAVD